VADAERGPDMNCTALYAKKFASGPS